MAVAKVTLNNNVIVDMTDATAAANKILASETAYIADGTKATGSAVIAPESGYFVTADTSPSFNLPVTRLCSKVVIWAEDVNANTDLSSKPYPAHSIFMMTVNNENGFFYAYKVSSTQTSKDAGGGNIAGWPNNATTGNNSCQFTSSAIIANVLRVGGATRPFINGEKYFWEAW